MLEAKELTARGSDLEQAFPPGLLIGGEEVRARLKDPSLVIVNVLPREAFLAGHIPGSISLSVTEINERAGLILQSPSQEVAVYCANPT
jgi:rhodanese-related sulfurtransferase